MSARSPLNKVFQLLAVAAGFMWLHGYAADIDPLSGYHTRDDVQGLFEIRAAAREFIAKENIKNKSQWEAMDPNLKIQVTRCAVPLRVKWVPKSYGLSKSSVAVVCAKTVDPKIEKHWDVLVPVYK